MTNILTLSGPTNHQNGQRTLNKWDSADKPIIKKWDAVEQAIIENSMKFDEIIKVAMSLGKKFDADETKFLQRSLIEINERVLQADYPDLTSMLLFQRGRSVPFGADSVEFQIREWNGRAKIIAGSATDIPKVDYKNTPDQRPVRTIAISWDVSWKDIQRAIFANEPIQSNKAMDAMDAIAETKNDLNWGLLPDDERYGVTGFFNDLGNVIQNTDISSGYLNNFNILDGANTGLDIYNFLIKAITVPRAFTNKEKYKPTRLALPIPQTDLIESTLVSVDGNSTKPVAQAVLENTSIDMIVACPELKADRTPTGTDAMVLANTDGAASELRESNVVTLPTQTSGLQFDNFVVSGSAGLLIRKKTMAYVANVGAP